MYKIDLSKTKTSITAKVESLIGNMQNLTHMQIQEELLNILENPETHASPETRSKWKTSILAKKNKTSLMYLITNLYLAGANLSTNPK